MIAAKLAAVEFCKLITELETELSVEDTEATFAETLFTVEDKVVTETTSAGV